MADAVFVRDWNEQLLTAVAAVAVGEVWQTADGAAAVYRPSAAADAGARAKFETAGKFTFTLASSITILDGGRVYWDHSANNATYKKVNDRDFYLGRAVGDTTAGTVVVDLNKDPPYDIDALRHGCLIVPVGTQVVGAFGYPIDFGGTKLLQLTATNEAQKIDMLSVDGFDDTANAIIEAIFRVSDGGAGAAADFNIGIANGTHATNFDSVTEFVAFHIDANNTNINAQSDGGAGDTPVTATDTTKDYVAGSAVANRVEVWIDMRTPGDCQLYVNAVNVLPSSVFDVDDAAGPLFLIAHLEKTSSTDTFAVYIDTLRARFAEQ